MTLWRGYVAACTVLMAVYFLVPAGPAADSVYIAIALVGSSAILVGVVVNRPATNAPWLLFAAGSLTWAGGDLLFSWQPEPPLFGSIVDIAYLGAYPLLIAGAVLLIRRRGPRLDLPAVIDSALVLVALGLVSWVWIAGPAFTQPGVPTTERVLAVAYPAFDIVLMAALVRLVATPGTPSNAFRLLVGAVALQIVADTALAASPATASTYARQLDLLWLTSYALWGAAALHPDMTRLTDRVSSRRDRFTIRRMAILGAATLLPPTAFVIGLIGGRPIPSAVLVGAATVLPMLVLARMACAVGEIRAGATQRDRLQDELLHRSTHDGLTGLLNRAGILRLTEAALGRGQQSGVATGLVIVDLDQFASFTDTWGPDASDAVLVETARRVSAAAGAFHPVGRVGDDEFAVLVEGCDAEVRAMTIASAVVAELHVPHHLGGRTIDVLARTGLSLSLDAGTDAAELMREAQIANRRAQVSSRATFEVFDHHARRELEARSEVEDGLRRALRDGGLELRYQPVVAVGTGAVDGYEALVRWNHPDGVLRTPDAFIPIAEKTDLICDLGRWSLHAATQQFSAWLAADPGRFADLTVAVNISARHLARPQLIDDVADALRESGLDGHYLVIEVTETVLVDVPHAIVQLDGLRAIGVSVSLDDFGTGYTSIGQLRDLPVDTIKIDRSFLASAPGAAELIELMTAAAHSCGMLVVAEGVERHDQLDILRGLACDSAQGFLFDPPLPADAILGAGAHAHESAPRLRIVRDGGGPGSVPREST